jgi:integrase
MQIRGMGHLYRPRYRTKDGEKRTAGVYWWKAPSGQRYSTGERDETAAQAWALERISEARRGEPARVGAPARYDDLERMLLDDWKAKGRKGVQQAAARLRHLRKAFSGWAAAAITTDRTTSYALRRQDEGAAPATVNLEIAILHRSFVLAKRAGRIRDVPIMDRLKGVRHRTGVVERGDFEAVCSRLAARYVPVARFLYLTGWREREALTLTWAHVDLSAGELHLAAENSKNREARAFPYASSPGLTALLQAQHDCRRVLSPYVFPGRAGRPLDRTGLQKRWREACIAAGVPAALIHDLRRTAARDLRRAGVAPYVAMAQLGHRDVRTHQAYSVVLKEDQADAITRLEQLRAGEPVQQRLLGWR